MWKSTRQIKTFLQLEIPQPAKANIGLSWISLTDKSLTATMFLLHYLCPPTLSKSGYKPAHGSQMSLCAPQYHLPRASSHPNLDIPGDLGLNFSTQCLTWVPT